MGHRDGSGFNGDPVTLSSPVKGFMLFSRGCCGAGTEKKPTNLEGSLAPIPGKIPLRQTALSLKAEALIPCPELLRLQEHFISSKIAVLPFEPASPLSSSNHRSYRKCPKLELFGPIPLYRTSNW
jgi:hypothetical protein